MSRRRNLPLTEAQQRRFSPATVSAMVVAARRTGAADALAWVTASAVGSLISPDGGFRELAPGDAKYVRGVLLTYDHRGQLRRMELVPDRETGERRPLTVRAYQSRVKRWVGAGLAHRCTRSGPITLLLDARWLPGNPCPWGDCPSMQRDLAHQDADGADPSASMVRSERTNGALGAHEWCVHGRGADSECADCEADLLERVSRERTDGAFTAGVQRGEERVSPFLPVQEEETENAPRAEESVTP